MLYSIAFPVCYNVEIDHQFSTISFNNKCPASTAPLHQIPMKKRAVHGKYYVADNFSFWFFFLSSISIS